MGDKRLDLFDDARQQPGSQAVVGYARYQRRQALQQPENKINGSQCRFSVMISPKARCIHAYIVTPTLMICVVVMGDCSVVSASIRQRWISP